MPGARMLQSLLQLAKHFDIRVEFGREQEFNAEPRSMRRKNYHHNKITLSMHPQRLTNLNCAYEASKDLAHELGHFFAASPGRRYRRDYGIPPETIHARPYWDLDEAKARLIENYLLKRFGGKSVLRPLRNVRGGLKTVQPKAELWWRKEGETMMSTTIRKWRAVRRL